MPPAPVAAVPVPVSLRRVLPPPSAPESNSPLQIVTSLRISIKINARSPDYNSRYLSSGWRRSAPAARQPRHGRHPRGGRAGEADGGPSSGGNNSPAPSPSRSKSINSYMKTLICSNPFMCKEGRCLADRSPGGPFREISALADTAICMSLDRARVRQ